MSPTDVALVAEIAERDKHYRTFWATEAERYPNEFRAERDRRDLLRIVREQEAQLDTLVTAMEKVERNLLQIEHDLAPGGPS